mgnify:CR=1 FL=1
MIEKLKSVITLLCSVGVFTVFLYRHTENSCGGYIALQP